MERNEERYREVHRRYAGEGVTVHWEPALCIHAANCLRHLPGVFDARRRPWVDLSGANAEDVIAAVRSCPTGALRYERTDGREPEAEEPTEIEPRLHGPVYLRGNLRVVDSRGNVLREATRLALCRCGHSQNKPFCDLSHRAADFTTT